MKLNENLYSHNAEHQLIATHSDKRKERDQVTNYTAYGLHIYDIYHLCLSVCVKQYYCGPITQCSRNGWSPRVFN